MSKCHLINATTHERLPSSLLGNNLIKLGNEFIQVSAELRNLYKDSTTDNTIACIAYSKRLNELIFEIEQYKAEYNMSICYTL